MRISVYDVLGWLAAGMSVAEIFDTIRLISARQATRREQEVYEEG